MRRKARNAAVRAHRWAQDRALQREDDGMTTAELLGNAALSIGVLVVLWAALNAMGTNVITWIQDQITQ